MIATSTEKVPAMTATTIEVSIGSLVVEFGGQFDCFGHCGGFGWLEFGIVHPFKAVVAVAWFVVSPGGAGR